ncbi:TonB-dependent receptor domain-containing protein [Natronogracilivirga saccharolytica]|uniref:TonB-dependent receptor n=1 Tax=Natronogracilivirga saccharolytica TaxID=2812953 RepID=A0A8J7UXK1_9BACT|nr:TonB-dependent receptor [Natronogracilivirga saccharolytica]MBP3193419.1 TonB-dependent receptor [Natronogracilivirga saccharolytica]
MFITLLTFLFAFSATPQAGPTGTLEGTVTNNNNNTLPHAHVALPDINKGTITRRDGSFSISDVPAGEYRAVISHVGYDAFEKKVAISENERTRIEVRLKASYEMPQVEIVGRSPERMVRIPGSASLVTAERLEQIEPLSGTEVLRQVPGIHSVDHEGMGLRANIGIRGLDPDRSRNVLMLEDGIPVALAPYGEPEMYYTPAITRMESVEVIKGSGAIKFGPQTVGGVINYITPDPPPEPELTAYITGGERGYFTSRLGYGNTYGNSGFQITWLRRQGDNIGPLNFHLNDLSAKWKLVLGDKSVLGANLSIYDEQSNSTYVGMSQPMYESGRYHFTDLAPDDELDIRRYSANLTHDYFFSDNVRLRTSAYAYTTRRNWSRQDFDNQPVDGRQYSRVVGNEDEPFGALWFRETTGNRNREFEVIGIEPRFSARYYTGEFRNELDAGFRYLYERAFEQRVNGSIDSPKTGDIRDDEIRTGYAASGFVQNRFYATDRLTFTPGIRVEYFQYERDIMRNNFEDVSRTSSDETLAFIPGFGVNYQLGHLSSLFAGVHRGFSPPRVKDAITPAGDSEELEAEWSWSYEAGFRLSPARYLSSEVTTYYMTFENQIIPVSESAGGQGLPNATGLTNGGATEHYGLEFLVRLTPFITEETGITPEFEIGGTWSRASFSEDRFVSSDGEIVNVKGNELPYAPEWSGFSQLSMRHETGVSGYIKATYTGEQFGDVLNRTGPTGNGREGMLDSYTVLDAGLRYQLPFDYDSSVSVTIRNLTDERYISSRRPQGIRMGLPRMITFGIDLKI